MIDNVIDPRLLNILRCPTSGLPLEIKGDGLVSADGSTRYPVVAGIPCLMPDSIEPTHAGYRVVVDENRRQGHANINGEDVASFVQAMIVSTCGNLFRGTNLRGAYPIPDFPRVFRADTILEVGCNWGRWSIAGAKAGYKLIGMDIHLKALMCARSLSRELTPGNEPFFVLADARHMPFRPESFGGVFSYSCIQHFSKKHAEVILSEISRVMKRQAKSVIQMAHRGGIRSTVALGRRMFSGGAEFDVRYYSIPNLLQLLESSIGPSEWYVDCFFGLNVHSSDRHLVPYSKRWIVDLAELFLWASTRVPFVGKFSDSVFVSSTKS